MCAALFIPQEKGREQQIMLLLSSGDLHKYFQIITFISGGCCCFLENIGVKKCCFYMTKFKECSAHWCLSVMLYLGDEHWER